MDPILVQLARQLFALQRRKTKIAPAVVADATRVGASSAAVAGLTPAERADIDAYVRETSEGKYSLENVEAVLQDPEFTGVTMRNVGRSLAQGATLNTADELQGMPVIPTPVGAIPNPLFRSPDATEEARLRGEVFGAVHPGVDITAKMGGSVAAMAPLAFAAPATGAGAIVANAAAGALASNVAARGAAETPEEGDAAAPMATVAGGVLSALIPGLVAGVKYLKDPVAYTSKAAMRGAILRSGGVDALKTENAALAAAGRGKESVVADLSRPLLALADKAANSDPNVWENINALHTGRMVDMPQRFLDDMRVLLGGKKGQLPNAAARRAKMEAAVQARGDEMYDAIRASMQDGVPGFHIPSKADVVAAARAQMALDAMQNQPWWQTAQATPAVQRIVTQLQAEIDNAQAMPEVLRQPKVQNALREAQRTGMTGAALEPADFASFDKLLEVKQRVDGMTGRAFAAGNTGLGIKLKEAAQMIGQHLEDNVPAYKSVVNEYHRMNNLVDQIGEGEAWWEKGDVRGLQSTIEQLNAEQVSQLRYGLASKLVAKMESAQPGDNITKQLAQPSVNMQRKLEIIFDSRQVFNDFMARARAEQRMARLGSATGNSKTALRTNTGLTEDPMDMGLRTVSTNVTSPRLTEHVLWRALARATRQQHSRETAQALEPLLMTRGTAAIDALLESFRNQAPTVPPWATPVSVGAAAQVSPLMQRP